MANILRVLYFLGRAMRRPYWDEARLRRFQEKRLRLVVENAYRSVPFYHEKFKEVGIKPSDIRGLDDLRKLPVVRKSELKGVDAAKLVSAEFDVERLKVNRTSGSTGQPFTTYLSRVEDDWRKSIYMRANISCGQRLRDRWVVVTAPHHFSDTTSIQRKLGVFAQTCVSIFDGIDKQIELISQARPDVLDGYSGALLLIAKEVNRQGLGLIRPRIVFGTADLMDVVSRRFMEEVFGAPYYDQFGCAEIDRSAWQCPERVRYHMDVDSVVMEFVDEDGEGVSAGERGEVVYTSLFNFAMPFIRYAVGDVGIPSDDECPCGRRLPLMEVVEGRRDSLLVLPDGRLLSPRVVTNAMSRFFEKVVQYRVVQRKVDLFEVFVRVREGVDTGVFERELIEHIKRVLGLGDDVTIAVRFVDDVPLSKSGKLMSVVSELKG
ncbi:MAG: phenylacetate--CoA ligase family protein [Candidatus Bathyarchaeia archaeon]|jgi:phenylacetate-CoA ligase|nr:phenylacetate--CoA ligase family protein [Candidatus Bathyarchaeota archaeon A05DMB-4]